MPESPLIIFDKVSKTFGDNQVLKALDLSVHHGEKLCLIGPSGSGKSTILRLLMTLETPSAGEIRIDDQVLWPDFADRPRKSFGKLSRDEKARQKKLSLEVGMVFQHFNLFPHLSVKENITLAPKLVAGLKRSVADDKAKALLDQVGLADKVDAWPGDLSGGQKQRVAIARALAMQPKMMLFDEATSALDPELVGEVIEVIEKLAESTDMTMLFVTHQMHFVQRIADRVVLLDEGAIVESGAPDEVLSSPKHERTKSFLAALEMA